MADRDWGKPKEIVKNSRRGTSFNSDVIDVGGYNGCAVQVNVTNAVVAADAVTADCAKIATKVIQDLTYAADDAGAAGNSITVEYLDSTKASLVEQDLTHTADAKGSAGNSISVEYATGGSAGNEVVSVVGTDISVSIQDDASNPIRGFDSGIAATLVEQDLTFTADTRGAAGNSITIAYTAAQTATGTITISDHEALISGTADTFTVGTTAFTAVVTASTPGVAEFTAQTSNEDTAISLAAQINAHATTSAEVVAVAVGATVTISYITVGTAGNTYALAYTDNDTNVGGSVSGATLSGGTGDVAGSEVVLVVGSAITVIIEDGVSTATQIKDAIDADVGAAALVDIAISGTGSNAQSAVGATNLSGGVDSDVTVASDSIYILSHGYSNKIKVRLATSGTLPAPLAVLTDYWVIVVDPDNIKLAASFADAGTATAITITDDGSDSATHSVLPQNTTATQLKAAIDASGPAAALIDVAITGTGSNLQEVLAQTNLSGGFGGAAGSEEVVVTGTDIQVYIEDGVSTEAQVKTAVEASVDAAALVDITVSGTPGTAQVAAAAVNLAGGADSDFNVTTNEVTIPSHGFSTGAVFQVTKSGAAFPDPLLASTDYYAIVVNPNTIKIAESLNEAIAGTAVDLIADGSADSTITLTPLALTLDVKPQVSVDGVNFEDVESSVNMSFTDNGYDVSSISNLECPYFRMNFTVTSGTADVSCWLYAKQ